MPTRHHELTVVGHKDMSRSLGIDWNDNFSAFLLGDEIFAILIGSRCIDVNDPNTLPLIFLLRSKLLDRNSFLIFFAASVYSKFIPIGRFWVVLLIAQKFIANSGFSDRTNCQIRKTKE